jgi:hypothetical protein
MQVLLLFYQTYKICQVVSGLSYCLHSDWVCSKNFCKKASDALVPALSRQLRGFNKKRPKTEVPGRSGMLILVEGGRDQAAIL